MALKVFDLQCEHGHLFEGWFGSHDDYDTQQAHGLLTCPVCNSSTIRKRFSAPHLSMTRHADATRPADPTHQAFRPTTPDVQIADLQATMFRHVRELVKNTENVGTRFAEEARRIHEGEAPERPIRGVATAKERESLSDEGIEVLSVPDFLDDTSLQ